MADGRAPDGVAAAVLVFPAAQRAAARPALSVADDDDRHTNPRSARATRDDRGEQDVGLRTANREMRRCKRADQ
jgi:hypothetical protein